MDWTGAQALRTLPLQRRAGDGGPGADEGTEKVARVVRGVDPPLNRDRSWIGSSLLIYAEDVEEVLGTMRCAFLVGLLLLRSTTCTVEDSCETAETSLLQSHGGGQIAMNGAVKVAKELPLLDIQIHKSTQCLVSNFMRTFFKACEVMELYGSTSATFPLSLVAENNFSVFGLGVTSYFPILTADFFNATTYLPYTSDEYTFLIKWQAELDVRVAEFALAATVLSPITPMAIAHQSYTKIAETVNGDKSFPQFVQGYGDHWNNDTYAGQLVGHTFIACMLEATSHGFLLDLSESGTSKAPVQLMKRAAVATAPSSLLRTRGHFTSGSQLISIEIQDPSGPWMQFAPSDGVKWTMAKVSLFALAFFVVECYHTGIHLFAGSVTSAIKKAVPAGTSLGQAVSPNTLQTIFALFEQASILHSSHGSAFSGTTWSCNITEVWATTRQIARYYLNTAPKDILGMNESSPDWWAGGSASFIEPIESFADFAAQQASAPSDMSVLANLQLELQNIGLWTEGSTQVTTPSGLSEFIRNFLFVAGICHSHMYLTREFFTPLAGFTTTEPFLPYLQSPVSLLGFEVIVELLFPTVPATVNSLLILVYGTASGFGSGVPQLGDGPYPEGDDGLNGAVEAFQQGLNASRQLVYGMFGNFTGGSFVPGYLYPVDVPKPFGYAITQTAYI